MLRMSQGLRATGERREKIRRMFVRFGLLVFIVLCYSSTLVTRENARDKAVVRFAYQASGGDRSTPLGGYKTPLTRATQRVKIS